MDITLPIAVVVTIIGGIFASGITVGGLVSRFIAREKCENLRKECKDSFSQKIDRVHVRLDEILLLLGDKKK
jgi:hypothetical protein